MILNLMLPNSVTLKMYLVANYDQSDSKKSSCGREYTKR